MSIGNIHGGLGNASLIYAGILAIWGLFRYIRKEGVDSNYWGSLVIAEILIIVQALIGVYMWSTGIGELSREWVHILYGVISVLTIPGIFLFSKGDNSRRTMLLYGVALLFLAGILYRSISTGG